MAALFDERKKNEELRKKLAEEAKVRRAEECKKLEENEIVEASPEPKSMPVYEIPQASVAASKSVAVINVVGTDPPVEDVAASINKSKAMKALIKLGCSGFVASKVYRAVEAGEIPGIKLA